MSVPKQVLVKHESEGGDRVSKVRGSLIVSSLQTLREKALVERYLRNLAKEHHEPLLFALAASWLPIELAMAHYQACEAMELTEAEIDAIGQHVSNRIMGTFLGTLLRSSRSLGAGTSPMVPLRQYHRLWDRLLVGGSCAVSHSGPKDVTIESRGLPAFRYRYFRMAYIGLIKGAGLMFTRTIYTRVRSATDESLTLEASWV